MQMIIKRNYYDIRCVLHNSLRSYLSQRKQYILINFFDSTVAFVNCDVPQGSFVGPL